MVSSFVGLGLGLKYSNTHPTQEREFYERESKATAVGAAIGMLRVNHQRVPINL